MLILMNIGEIYNFNKCQSHLLVSVMTLYVVSNKHEEQTRHFNIDFQQFPVVVVVVISVLCKEGITFCRLINEFIKGKSLILPVNGGISGFEPE